MHRHWLRIQMHCDLLYIPAMIDYWEEGKEVGDAKEEISTVEQLNLGR